VPNDKRLQLSAYHAKIFLARLIRDLAITVVVRQAVCRACRDIESLRARAGESMRQVEELFQSLLAQSFSEGLHEAFRG